MSDVKNEIPAPTPLSITRNNTSLTLTPKQFGKKSKNSGAWYQTPEISPASFETIVPWFGTQFVCDVINKASRLIGQDIYLGNISETDGKLDGVKYAAELTDFTEGIAKLGDLEEDKEELEIQLAAAVNDPLFTETDDNDVATEASKTLQVEAKRIGSLIKPIRKQIAAIEAKYALRSAARKAKAEAAKTNVKAPTEQEAVAAQ